MARDSKVLKDIHILKDISLKDIRLPCKSFIGTGNKYLFPAHTLGFSVPKGQVYFTRIMIAEAYKRGNQDYAYSLLGFINHS